MSKTVWTKPDGYSGLSTESITEYRGVKIERGALHSWGRHYYFHWCTNLHWNSSHSHMSDAHKSLQSVKRAIDYMLDQECATAEKSLHVTRFNVNTQIREMILKLNKIKASNKNCESTEYLCDKHIERLNKYLIETKGA